ncbi:hypothetical protein ZIOFF_061055 [Zingiber officinale]|uniref:FAD-binding PCMH-type domain-containing protein n=1 Tax=Zingiber officinale TaxID=94328 RepID=A0A8J5KCH9_ZINOF|nr:hypothetical protein ZIOFF_061055 [Zingiber officinale]
MGLLSSALFVASSRTFLFRFFRRARPSFGGRSHRSDAASNRSVAWSRVLLPLAVAASAGSALAFDLSRVSSPCLCDPGLESCVRRGDTDRVVKGSRTEVIDEFIRELKDVLQDNMTVDYEERFFHGTPQNSFHRAVNVPDVIVFPRSQDDVHKIVVVCNKYKVPIVPYGGATSIEGQTLSPHGGVCIDMSLMKLLVLRKPGSNKRTSLTLAEKVRGRYFMNSFVITRNTQSYREAIQAIDQIETPAVGFVKPSDYQGATSVLSAYQNAVMHALMGIGGRFYLGDDVWLKLDFSIAQYDTKKFYLRNCYLHLRGTEYQSVLFTDVEHNLQKIKSPNVEDMDVVVEPGVGWIELNEYLKPFGLFFPLDPGERT